MLLWILAALAAYYVKGLCGFANTLVFTSIMGFGADNINISPVELLLSFPTNLIMAWRNRRLVKFEIVAPTAALVIAGSIPAAFLLKNADAGALKVFFGIVVVLMGLEMLAREAGKLKSNESKGLLSFIALLSGLLCGLFGVGALLAAYIGRVTKTTDEFKANISFVFIVENIIRIIVYSVIGVLTIDALKQGAILVPVMLAGLFFGEKAPKS